MATSDLATVFDDWAVAWSSHDADKLLALVTDDCIYEDVTTGIVNRSKPELRDFATAFFVAFPDFDVPIRTRFASGSQASAEWIMTGTHTGDLPSIRDLPGMPATNKRISVRGASVIDLQGNKIRRCSDYWDMATFLKQLGLMPSQ